MLEEQDTSTWLTRWLCLKGIKHTNGFAQTLWILLMSFTSSTCTANKTTEAGYVSHTT